MMADGLAGRLALEEGSEARLSLRKDSHTLFRLRRR